MQVYALLFLGIDRVSIDQKMHGFVGIDIAALYELAEPEHRRNQGRINPIETAQYLLQRQVVGDGKINSGLQISVATDLSSHQEITKVYINYRADVL